MAKFDRVTGGYRIADFVDWAWEGEMFEIVPGESVFVYNGSGGAFTNTFSGQIARFDRTLPPGLHFLGTLYPDGTELDSRFGLEVGNYDVFAPYRPPLGGYEIYMFSDGAWENGPPRFRLGEGFVADLNGFRRWVRTFAASD